MGDMQAADYERMKTLAKTVTKQLKKLESSLSSMDAARRQMGESWMGFAGSYHNNALFWAMDSMKGSVEDMQQRADQLRRAGERHELADIEATKIAMNIEQATWAEV